MKNILNQMEYKTETIKSRAIEREKKTLLKTSLYTKLYSCGLNIAEMLLLRDAKRRIAGMRPNL